MFVVVFSKHMTVIMLYYFIIINVFPRCFNLNTVIIDMITFRAQSTLLRSCHLAYSHFSWTGLVLQVVNQYFVHILLLVTALFDAKRGE